MASGEQHSRQAPLVVLRDERSGKWLQFADPCELLVAQRIEDVLPHLRRIEEATQRQGLHAAGFVSYEAAPAFDPALPAKSDPAFPLLWFGLFRERVEVDHLPAGDSVGLAPLEWASSITDDEYDRCFGRIREYIRDGDTYQVNYTYRMRAATDADPWDLFLELTAGQEPPFAAFVDAGEWTVCSASPELFFRLDGDRIESRPMKGTAGRGLWFEDDVSKAANLRASEKERAENLMIVDMVRNDLGRVAETGSVEVPALFTVEQYPTVWQMTSTVRATTTAALDRIFGALFPPASITGAPKRRTMEIIAELETTPRRVYTGAIGYVSPGRQAQFSVAIRTLLINRNDRQAEYGVGGGIVWDSRADSERAECAVKARILRERRPEFDLLETMLWLPGSGYELLSYHLDRLGHSAAYFGFSVDLARVRSELDRVGAGLDGTPYKVRLLVARSGACRCEASPNADGPAGFGEVALAASPVDSKDVFLYHKTTRRRVYEDALKSRPGFGDVLLFNEKGEVTESTIANVAVEIDGALCTPPVRCGLLPGTYRAWMLEQGKLVEKPLRIEEALSSPNVYLMNSVRGMWSILVERNRYVIE